MDSNATCKAYPQWYGLRLSASSKGMLEMVYRRRCFFIDLDAPAVIRIEPIGKEGPFRSQSL